MNFFQISEFDCQHTGKNEMQPEFLSYIDKLREMCGFPFKITSGYRDSSHPEEAKKSTSGFHSMGVAADIAVYNGIQKYEIVDNAIELGFTGIGIAKTFIHVDTRTLVHPELPKVIWSY